MTPVGRGAMRQIGFARHGETAWTGRRYAGRTDLPLTDEGRVTASRLTADVIRSGLLDDPGSIIVASPLARAAETARIVAQAAGRPVEIDPRWVEVSFGALEGLTFDEATGHWPEVARRLASGDVEIDWPGGESWPDLERRVSEALAAILARAVPILVVAHGIAIRAALPGLTVVPGASVAPGASLVLTTLPAGGLVIARETDGGWVKVPRVSAGEPG